MKTFVDDDKVQSGLSIGKMLMRLWPYAKRFPWLLIITIISILGLAITSRLLPWLFGHAIDEGILKKNSDLVLRVAMFYLAVEVVRAAFDFAYLFYFQKLGQKVLTDIRQDLIVRVQSLPIDYFNKNPIGRIVTRLTNDTATLSEVFSNGVIQIVTETVILISIVVAMALISWKLTLVTLVTAPLFLYLAFSLASRLRVILREAKRRLSTLSSYASEQLSGIRVVQIYNRRQQSFARFRDQSGRYRDALLNSIHHYAMLQPLMNVFNGVTLTLALAYGGYLTLEEAIPMGAMVAYLMHAQDLISPLREILEKFQQFQNSLTSAERVFHTLDEKPEVLGRTVQELKINGDIRFENLSFRYSADLPWVIQNFNLEVPAGRKIALVGRTGSGKSTLVALLQRFYEAPARTLFIDNQPIESYDLRSLRRRVGVVQQDPFLFRGSIEENLRLGQHEFTRGDLQRALDRIGYGDFLRSTGRGLDTMIEERGANLSSGERQLLSFARILVFEPDILILDEATAHIDSQSEQLIQKATEEVTTGRTSLIVAHRLSTIEKCDQILVLDQGLLKEKGTHQELMGQKGLYYQVASAGLKSTTI